MALGESQDCNSTARGCEAMSFFVCLLYAFKAAVSIVSKLVEEVEVEGIWDIVAEEAWLDTQGIRRKSQGGKRV